MTNSSLSTSENCYESPKYTAAIADRACGIGLGKCRPIVREAFINQSESQLVRYTLYNIGGRFQK